MPGLCSCGVLATRAFRVLFSSLSKNHSESERFIETWRACPGIARNPDLQEVETVSVGTQLPE